MPENFLEINRYFALTSYCNTIGQSNNAFSILGFSLAGNRRGHALIFSFKVRKKGNKKRATCFATLLQNELKSDVVRFTTHIKPVNNLICCKRGLMWVVKHVARFLLPVFPYLCWQIKQVTNTYRNHFPRT